MPLLREVFSHHRNVSSFLQLIEHCLYIKSRSKNKAVLIEEEKLSYWKDGNKESYSLNYGYNYFGEYLILRESWDYANIYYHLKTDRIILCYEPSFLSSSHDGYDFDEFLEALLWWKSIIEEKLGEKLEDIEVK